MSWSMLSHNVIGHADGSLIELTGGTWRNPVGIRPVYSPKLSKRERDLRLVEGMNHISNNLDELEKALHRQGSFTRKQANTWQPRLLLY